MQPLLPEPAPLVSMTPPFPGSSLRSRAPSSFAPTSTTAAHVPPPSSPGLNTDTPQARVEQQRPELGHSSSSARAIPRDTEFEIVHDSGISTAHAKPNITLGPKKNISPSQSPLRSPPPPPTTTAASSPESPTQAPAPAISHHPPLPDAIPPTLREILHAYTLQDDARKHRGMLLDVLRAKSAEDQRIAALANVKLIQMQASLLQLGTALSNASDGAGPSPLEILLRASSVGGVGVSAGVGFGGVTDGGASPSPLSSLSPSLSLSSEQVVLAAAKNMVGNTQAPGASGSDAPTTTSASTAHQRASHSQSSASASTARPLSPHGRYTRQDSAGIEIDVDMNADMDPEPDDSEEDQNSHSHSHLHLHNAHAQGHGHGHGQMRRLSPPISHIRSGSRNQVENSAGHGPPSRVQHKPSSSSSPPSTHHSGPHYTPLSSASIRTTTTTATMTKVGGGGNTNTTTIATPACSRKPLAQLLAPLPTHSILYPSSRRNNQTGITTNRTHAPNQSSGQNQGGVHISGNGSGSGSGPTGASRNGGGGGAEGQSLTGSTRTITYSSSFSETVAATAAANTETKDGGAGIPPEKSTADAPTGTGTGASFVVIDEHHRGLEREERNTEDA